MIWVAFHLIISTYVHSSHLLFGVNELTIRQNIIIQLNV